MNMSEEFIILKGSLIPHKSILQDDELHDSVHLIKKVISAVFCLKVEITFLSAFYLTCNRSAFVE